MKCALLAAAALLACSANTGFEAESKQLNLASGLDVSVTDEGPQALIRAVLPSNVLPLNGGALPVLSTTAGPLESNFVVLHNVVGQPDTLVVLARGNLKSGDAVSVSYGGFSGSGVARRVARTTYPIQFLFRDPSIDAADTRRSFAAAAAGIEQECGISFNVIDDDVRAPTVDTSKLIKGYSFIDEFPISFAVPSTFGIVLGPIRTAAIRVVVSMSGDSMAGADFAYELRNVKFNPGNAYRFIIPIQTYNIDALNLEATLQKQTGRDFNVVTLNAHDTTVNWPIGRIALHEIGHMIGLNHHDQTEEVFDNYGNNWMVQGQNVSVLPQRGTSPAPFATPTQCAVAGLNLARWAR